MLIADLHIHSKYSRATSKECVPEHLELWARRKGIDLIGTGDFTHPAWRAELCEKLVPAEEGLYRLRDELRLRDETASFEARPRFVLSAEISSIYKKNGRVRKVHNLILLPGLEEAHTLSKRLEAIGNIHSDGRPILGLDSRDLLAITLEVCPTAIFIPAHIWTPHFSLFGAFSGFDTIEECFEDLTCHIHALETGLSSDPPMNRRLSALDRFHLISNSDAHSPSKLGREATLLDTGLSYAALAGAIEKGAAGGLAGTLEFFPEEGKYHYDGHRNCGLCLSPEQAKQLGGKCPVCGKKLTIGVQHRVDQLADRAPGYAPGNPLPFESMVPLEEVIAVSTGRTCASKKVHQTYLQMLARLGPEFAVLRLAPLEEIGRSFGLCVEEGIRRLREGRVERSPGFDGAYGTIHLLSRWEIDMLSGQTMLFSGGAFEGKKEKTPFAQQKNPPAQNARQEDEARPQNQQSGSGGLNEQQREAVQTCQPAVAVIAGPGTGKTKTLIARIAHLVQERGVRPDQITAVTFTNQAAGEMRKRLEKHFGSRRAIRGMTIGTFHSICLALLRKERGEICIADEAQALEFAAQAAAQAGTKRSAAKVLQEISRWKSTGLLDPAVPEEICTRYDELLAQRGLLDFDDLLLQGLRLCETKSGAAGCFTHLLVDEFQDTSALQYRLIRAWSEGGEGLFIIGDPDQSIYGFRGSDAACFDRLGADFPQLHTIRLARNYRCTPEILRLALTAISHNPGGERSLCAHRQNGLPVRLVQASSELAESIFIAKEIGRMVGGVDMLDAQALGARGSEEKLRGFSDIAVLVRTHRQARVLEQCLRKEGIACLVSGRDAFLTEKPVRGAIGFFRFLLEPGHAGALEDALRLGLGCPEKTLQGLMPLWRKADPPTREELLSRFAQDQSVSRLLALRSLFAPDAAKENPAALVRRWVRENGLEGCEALELLIHTAVVYKDLNTLLQNLLLGAESDLARSADDRYTGDAVRLMTLHGAKGLEFPVVFLCGLSKGRIPLETPGKTNDPAEERRLFYVGLTRAQEELVLTASGEISAFAAQIPDEAVDRSKTGARQPRERQLSLFD